MIIRNTKIIENKQCAEIQCFINRGGVNEKYFIEVKKDFSKYLVSEVADPFILASILPALMAEEDLECDIISDDLFYHAPTIIYLLAKVFRKPCITIKPKHIVHLDFQPQGVGTGFSGGIDSLATYINHSGKECPEYYRITHLTLFNIGSYGNDYPQTLEKFNKDVERAQEFAQRVNLPLVTVNSNIGGLFTNKEIINYSLRSTICLSVAISALSKLFRIYYISSTGTIDDMKLNRYDMYFYENSLTQLLSTHNTNIFISEANIDRVEKTKIVASNSLSQDFLYVCAADIYNERFKTKYEKDTAPNCSECIKCVRTMITLDTLGIRDQFSSRFDFSKYDKQYKDHLLDIATKKGYDHFSREIYELMIDKGMKVPKSVMIRGWIRGNIRKFKYKII